ncbi:MAG: metallophosphoesterase family protein [Candidatus Krumholzibacteriota bacterium]|nr:metallophosphoesterase family protein [Candidatus Krumholzibacteriota bacterium]
MKIIVYSDIHANIEALEKVVTDLEARRPDLTVSLGDVVGYGGDPSACVELVERRSDIRICGNHDFAASRSSGGERFNITAALSIEWTRNALSEDEKSILREYPAMESRDECLFAHSSPSAPLEWEYIYTISQAERIFHEFSDRFIFIGHTHIPGVISFGEDTGARVENGTSIYIEPGRRYLVNPGSVGQPRDGKNEASYASLDFAEKRITIHRVAYDILGAQKKIRSQGLPESLASRLATAR